MTASVGSEAGRGSGIGQGLEGRLRNPWMAATLIGAVAGAGLAHVLIPGAAFGRHPIGPIDWEIIGFASCIGVSMGGAQSWALWRVLGVAGVRERWLPSLLWFALTAAGIVSMLLPLWTWDARAFLILPFLAAVPMLPGAIALGIAQWLLISRLTPVSYLWSVYTVVGAAGGSAAGVISALALRAPVPLEMIWALGIAAGIAGMQSLELVASLKGDRARRRQPSRLLVVGLGAALALFILFHAVL